MDDITPSLLKKIQSDFQKLFDKSSLISNMYAKVRDGTATYIEANEFAIETGEILAKAFGNNLSSAVLPDGKMYYNIAQRIIEPMMSNNYDLISDVAQQVQKSLNEKAGIGIKAIKPEMNQDRIDGIVNKVSSADYYDDVAWVLDEPIKNFSQSIVDDSVKENAEFHAKSGLQPVITRKVAGDCCEWCQAVAGTYQYPDDVPHDVYRRHQRCRCTVDYVPKNGKVQNVHTKKWKTEQEDDKIERRKDIGLKKESLNAQERNVRANWKLSAKTTRRHNGTKKEELGTVPVDRAKETLSYFNEQIKDSEVEHAIVIDKNGKVIHFVGETDAVDIFDVDLDGAYITHNHPASNGIVSFGEDDFYFLRENQGVSTFQCCNPEFEYEISVLKPIQDVSYNQIYMKGLNNCIIGDDVQDKAMEALAEMGYVRYDKRRIK